MSDIQITCINKPNRTSTHEAISHVGNSSGKWTREQVVSWIDTSTHTFFTMVGGTRANIGTVQGSNVKYLRTYADGKWNDNLLALPECA